MNFRELFRFGDQRRNYWSCSSFANWIRATFAKYEQPDALELGEWREWRIKNQREHPIVYWITETSLPFIQNTIHYPFDILDRIRTYVRNRFVDKVHYLPTRLAPGRWFDVDTRLLHGMFETLVDFVECEKAHMFAWTSEDNNKHLLPFVYRFRHLRFLRWSSIRSRELGMKYLEWEVNLEDDSCPGQAAQAKEVIALYTWWKDVRPGRADPHQASGWTEYCHQRRTAGKDFFSSFDDEKTPEEKQLVSDMLNRIHQIEQQYDQEDEDMMVRLIKVRRGLWT